MSKYYTPVANPPWRPLSALRLLRVATATRRRRALPDDNPGEFSLSSGVIRHTPRVQISRILFSATVLLGVAGATPALAAENGAQFDEVTVRVQPEYDDPGVMAVIEAKLNEDVSLPHTAEFLIPKSAHEPRIGMACEVPEGSGHVCKVYNTEAAGDFTSLTYNVTQARNLFFEYYWDPFSEQPEAEGGWEPYEWKSFKYEFKAPAPIKKLSIGVQEPRKAEEFKLDPAPIGDAQDQEGMKYNIYEYSDVQEGQVFTIAANYVKTDPALSSPRQDPGAAQVVNQTTGAGVVREDSLLRNVLLSLAVLFTGGLVVILWRSRSAPVRARPNVKVKAKSFVGAKFCSDCGSGLTPGVKICAECGAEI